SISLQAGAFFPLRILKNNPGVQANQTLLDGRKTSEKTLEGISAGVFYSFSGRKGLVLRGGLDYKRINERFEVRYTNKKVEVVQGVLTKTVDASGQTISQTTGDKTVTTTVEYSNTAYNSYQFLNLPIGIGYKRINNKSTWEMVGGMDVNLLFR